VNTRPSSGAEKLEGLLLDSTWYVEKRIQRSVEQSGLARSSCYMAINGQGEHAFIKAYDFRHDDINVDPEKLAEFLAEYLHEKRVHEYCSRLSRVTRVIGSGKVTVDGFGLVEGLHAVVFKNDGDQITFEALEDTSVLLMSGKPLNEKVVSHGPFVMNTQTEILEAMRDYQMGKMGVLIEE